MTKDQVNRLADVGKIYGYIKYFHPYLQYKSINWDSAFASHVPNVIAATTKDGYMVALNNLFSVLQDSMTVAFNPSKQSFSAPPLSYSIADSIMYINMRDFDALNKNTGERSSVLTKAFDSIRHVKGVIIDLRWDSSTLKKINNVQTGFDWSLRPERQLLSSRIYGPSYRTVMYTGFPGESNAYVRIYEATFKQHVKAIFTGQAKRDVPTVIIVNRYSKLPLQFLAMYESGKAAIIQQTGAGDITGNEIKFFVADSILIRMRIGELVNRDGSIGHKPNATYSGNNPEAAILKARELLSGGLKPIVLSPTVLEAPLAQQTSYTKEGTYPSIGYRALAAAKIYFIIDHFYPNKNLMDSSWEGMYKKYLPQIVAAKDSVEYMQAVAAFYNHLDDGHGFINSRVDLVHPLGYTSMPIAGRFINNQLVITNILNDSAASALGVKYGDIVLSIDGKRPFDMYNEKKRFVPASNEIYRLRNFSDFILMGTNGGKRQLKVQNSKGVIRTIDVPTSEALVKDWFVRSRPRYGEPMLRFITKDIGYVDLEKLQQSDVDSMFNMFKNTKAIIFDMRGYPKVTAWLIAPRLTEKRDVVFTKFAWLTPSMPNVNSIEEGVGRQHMLSYYDKLPEATGFIYKGKTVMLIDEYTMSQGEHTGLLLKAANNTTFIGSQTAGANGNVSNFIIPGRAVLYFSGLNVSYPNGETMQRIGLKPDIIIRPTIKGIQAGKDEVLQQAVKYLEQRK